MKALTIIAICAALVQPSALAHAHNEYRIIGTITKLSAKVLAIRQAKDGKIISIKIDDATLITRAKVKLTAAALKVGLYVAVDACGDSLKDLIAVEVHLRPDRKTQ